MSTYDFENHYSDVDLDIITCFSIKINAKNIKSPVNIKNIWININQSLRVINKKITIRNRRNGRLKIAQRERN